MGNKSKNTMYFIQMQILFVLIALGAISASKLPDNRSGAAFVETPEFSNGLKAIDDFVEKYALSECDKKQLDEVKESLNNQILDKTVSLAADSYSNMAAILEASTAPAAAVAAAFSGATIAKETIDVIRLVFPSLKGSACTDKIEDSVFGDVGGGALGGAGVGAAIGTFLFPGVGGAFGSAGGAVMYATQDMQEAIKFCQENPPPQPKGECKSVFAKKN